jgi:FkbM family methyltransferase
MISYAQNQEDVVLHRLVDLIPRGTFVDVGGGHPVLDNVTYALYLEGWRGVNVEPMPREAELHRELRPEDETLQLALGSKRGTLTLYEAPPDNRGATTSDPEIVARYNEAGQTFEPFDVEVRTLASILQTFEPGSVHVVKIDVEGMESAVITGAKLATTRPWVLVIEATVPNSRERSSKAWSKKVVSAGYELVLFDGLNEFYVRDDLPDVKQVLAAPANVFDQWVPYELERCRESIREAAEYAKNLEQQRDDAAPHVDALSKRAKHADRLESELSLAFARTERLERELAVLRAVVDASGARR